MFEALADFVDGPAPNNRRGVARESVDFLAQHCGVPRHFVTLVADGYDTKKHQAWALTKASSEGGSCCCLTIEPDDGQIQHQHRRLK